MRENLRATGKVCKVASEEGRQKGIRGREGSKAKWRVGDR